VMSSDDHAYLTRDEMLAVRLYSGPTYQLINGFLRQIARLTGDSRSAILRNPKLTFAATVACLYSAVRKLAAVATDEEARQPLYRGVRGELPDTFYRRDQQGMIAVVDDAFMSTSKKQQTPIDYMGPGSNVLWELQTSPESDVAYHYGADISQISQFGHESEVLFPPFTMLAVKERAPEPEPASPEERRKLKRRDSLARMESAKAELVAKEEAIAKAKAALEQAELKAAEDPEAAISFQQRDLLEGDWQEAKEKKIREAQDKIGIEQGAGQWSDRKKGGKFEHTKNATDAHLEKKELRERAGSLKEIEVDPAKVTRTQVGSDVQFSRDGKGGERVTVKYQAIKVTPCFI